MVDFLKDIMRGFHLGVETRKLFTELRTKSIDPWETENPNSPYYAKSEEFKKEISKPAYVGLCFGQLMHPREWYKNCKYLGFDCSSDDTIVVVYLSNQQRSFAKHELN